MKIRGILIKESGEIIYSRAGHDFRWDSSRKYAVDGGQGDGENVHYSRTIFEDEDGFVPIEFNLDVTRQELYDDWNKSIDKLGLIGPFEECDYVVLKR